MGALDRCDETGAVPCNSKPALCVGEREMTLRVSETEMGDGRMKDAARRALAAHHHQPPNPKLHTPVQFSI